MFYSKRWEYYTPPTSKTHSIVLENHHVIRKHCAFGNNLVLPCIEFFQDEKGGRG